MTDSYGQVGGSWSRGGSAANHHRQDEGRGYSLTIPRRNEFTSQQKAGRQKNGRDGPWRHGERDPARMGGGRGFAANNRRQERRGFGGTAQQQPESPFPAGQKHYPNRRPPGHDFSNQQKAGSNQMEEDADYSGHPESSERKKLLQHLLAIKSPKDRKKEFKKLSPEKSLSLVLNVNALPPQDVPLNWDEVQEKATVATAEWIKKAPLGKYAREEESSDSGYSSDGMYARPNACKPEPPYLDFSDTLRYCHPMTSGFHNKDRNGAFCYCPCGKNMANWRKIVGVQDFFEEKDNIDGADKLCNSGKKRPRELLQHVETLKAGCKAHEIIWKFLNEVFENYYEKGIRHIAFENKNSKEYNRAEAAIQKKAKT
jgi:hypothetical protein